MTLRSFSLALVLCCAAPAQGLHVVPALASSGDGNAIADAPGISTPRRTQVIVSAVELQPLVGHDIIGIRLRRDTSWSDALPGAQGQVVVRIGTSAHTPEDAEPSFGRNLPAPIEVFRGTIHAPNSPANPPGPSWASGSTIDIDFATGFTYQGGPLCVEFEPSSWSGVWWPVDAVSDAAAGLATNAGVACGAFATLGETAGVDEAGLVTGRTATFFLLGQPSSPAWLCIGFGPRNPPIDLTPFGSPGCALHVDPIAALPASLSTALPGFDGAGLANLDLHLPAQTGLLGASLAAQWIELQGTTITTSNALLCQVATVPPLLPVVAVVSRAGEPPDVVALAVPVLGLVWR